MIDKATLEFLLELKENNNREWFANNKLRYDVAKQNAISVAGKMVENINKFDPSLGFIDPRKTVFKIHRDTRFSNNKDPYKPNMGMAFSLDGVTRGVYACYYLHIEPSGKSLLAAGIYMPEPAVVKAIREYIDQHFQEFQSIISNQRFVETFKELSRDGKVLKRVPRGFDALSPAGEYLKLTNFSVMCPISDKELTDRDFVDKKCVEVFRVATPLVWFLNKAIRGEV